MGVTLDIVEVGARGDGVAHQEGRRYFVPFTLPGETVEAEPRGLNRLFVVLTRAVSRLDVLHARALPTPLDGLS